MFTKELQQEKVDQLLKDCKVFFAFNNEQFEENKTPLKDGEKYVSMGAGGYLPSSYAKQLSEGFKSINKWEKEAKKKMKADKREACILYELNNYECFYVQDITDALPVLLPHFTMDEIKAVYNKHLATQLENNY